jgi:hypothetical protein
MKKVFKVLYSLMTTAVLCNTSAEAATSVQFGVGYRSDDIKWRISAPESIQPDSYSKLNFRDVEIFLVEGKVKGMLGDCVYLRATADYGWIEDGTLREKDQLSQNVADLPPGSAAEYTIVTPSVHNDIDDKYVYDFSAGIGYPIHLDCEEFSFTPMLGFSYNTARISVQNRHLIADELSAAQQVTYEVDPASDENHSKYRQTFWGPWIGFDFAYMCQDCWSAYGEFEFHWARARFERNSNVGFEAWDNFERSRNAHGFKIVLGGTYSFCCDWFLDGHIGWQDWRSSKCGGNFKWQSFDIGLDVGYMF